MSMRPPKPQQPLIKMKKQESPKAKTPIKEVVAPEIDHSAERKKEEAI